jgi:hypothetical protein
MQYGIALPNIEPFADPFWLMELACEAEMLQGVGKKRLCLINAASSCP